MVQHYKDMIDEFLDCTSADLNLQLSFPPLDGTGEEMS